MSIWLLLLLCVFVPPAWSVCVRYVTMRAEKRKRLFQAGSKPPSDYSI